MMLRTTVVLSSFAISLFLTLSHGAIVEIEDGQIEGTTMTSRYGVSFEAYLRIPFAEPPLGELRFQAPQPLVTPWTGVFNGTYYGHMCVQMNGRPDLGISEDCLQLNVFTKNTTASVPVIVYIHGGAFIVGTGIDQGGPHHLMDRNVVVVNINYRLGALGFLATGTADAPGNAGLKDQVMALKWVNKNIAKFGGDPARVTITGLSAGALSVTAHMVSPMTKDLFQGVIAMSGSTVFQVPLKTEYLDLVKKVATELNCATTTVADMMTCLRTKPALDIVSVDVTNHPECELVSWISVVEPDFGQERFLIDQPNDSFRDGNFTRVPIMIGRTSEEFIDMVPRILGHQEGLKELNEKFETMGPQCFYYEKDTEKSKDMSRALRASYLPLDEIDVRSFNALNNLFGDSYIGYPVHRLVHFASNYTDVYYYKFSYVGTFSIFNYPHDKPYGVHHVDDLQYPFYVDYMGTQADFMVDRMTKIWEHFAWNGNPNYNSTEINWPKHDISNEFYMDIGTHLVEKNGLFLERYSVWDRLLSTETSSAIVLKSQQILSLTFLTLFISWFSF